MNRAVKMTLSHVNKIPRAEQIRSVIFDMDGTLCLPQPWMFPAMRKSIGLHDNSIDILAYIDELPTEEEKTQARTNIADIEYKAMVEMKSQPGLIPLFEYLNKKDISKNICTRNLIGPVNYFISTFINDNNLKNFDYILTRDYTPTKPFPDPLLHIMQNLNLTGNQVMMVGDSMDDMRSGRAAGCITVLLENQLNTHLKSNYDSYIDIVVRDLSDLIQILENLHNTKI